VKVEYYDVQGADQAALVQALNARSGGHAKSSWKLSYQYQPRREKGQCGVGSVLTQLDLAMTLPRWTPPGNAPAELAARWQKYVDALAAHENARLDKARELERALKPALEGLPLAADCNALDAAVVERYEALQQQGLRDVEAAETKSPVFE
jgi:predicted secreted Zn-dependent protease